MFLANLKHTTDMHPTQMRFSYTIAMLKNRFRWVWLGVICAGLFAGCKLPNVGPFVDATGQLKGAVASSGAAVEQELRLIPGAEAEANSLRTNWKARNQAMTALLRYADSLDVIVAAGNSGSESAGKIADLVNGLAEAAGVVMPGSPAAVAVATDLAKFLYAQVAIIRAARHLASALEAAQPAVEKIAELMRKDLDDLDKVVQAANAVVEANDAKEMSASGLGDHRKLIIEATKKSRDLSKKEDREELVELSKLMSDADARYAVYQAKLANNLERLRASRQLINAVGAALDAWSAGHAQLAVAARNNTTVNTRALVDAAVELRDLVKRIREL